MNSTPTPSEQPPSKDLRQTEVREVQWSKQRSSDDKFDFLIGKIGETVIFTASPERIDGSGGWTLRNFLIGDHDSWVPFGGEDAVKAKARDNLAHAVSVLALPVPVGDKPSVSGVAGKKYNSALANVMLLEGDYEGLADEVGKPSPPSSAVSPTEDLSNGPTPHPHTGSDSRDLRGTLGELVQVCKRVLPDWIPLPDDADGHICSEITNGDVRALIAAIAKTEARPVSSDGQAPVVSHSEAKPDLLATLNKTSARALESWLLAVDAKYNRSYKRGAEHGWTAAIQFVRNSVPQILSDATKKTDSVLQPKADSWDLDKILSDFILTATDEELEKAFKDAKFEFYRHVKPESGAASPWIREDTERIHILSLQIARALDDSDGTVRDFEIIREIISAAARGLPIPAQEGK